MAVAPLTELHFVRIVGPGVAATSLSGTCIEESNLNTKVTRQCADIPATCNNPCKCMKLEYRSRKEPLLDLVLRL